MAGYMNFLIPTGDDIGTEAHEVVDGTADTGFVAGNRRCRNDDRIAGHDADAAVVIGCHTGQPGHRFALATRRQDEDLISRITVELIRFDEDAFGHIEVAQFNGNLNVVDHAAAENGYLAFELDGRIDSLLDTGNIRANVAKIIRPLAARKLAEGMADRRFRFSVPRPFGIGTVRHQEQYAAAA